MQETLNDIRNFWENNPLWAGESKYEPGTKEFFDEHRNVVINDCFAGRLDERIIPDEVHRRHILDLGCGPGFWTVELGLRGCKEITAADLTEKALELTKRRCEIYGVNARLSQQNAEALTFKDKEFSHVNCIGVIHHTPDTAACIREIARVLEDNGTVCIAVYYRNIFLKAWPVLKWPGKLLAKLGGGLHGRGREGIFTVNSADEIVRLYDGKDNPIGESYTEKSFEKLICDYFITEETFLHFFPARALPFSMPSRLHQFLDKNLGFMIYKKLRKR